MSHALRPTLIKGARRLYRSVLLYLCLVIAATAVASAQSPAPWSPAPIGSPAPDAMRVVTTTTVFADIVRNVAREHASVVSIIPSGVGPEDYEARPNDAMLLQGADLVVRNGVGLDDFLDKLIQTAGGPGLPQLVLGDGIPTIDIDGAPNPHFWLDPTLVAQYYLPAITSELSTLDPAHAPDYAANAQAYAQQLTDLDTELQSVVATIPAEHRKLVTFHDAFPYLARHYGFELVGVVMANVGTEPSAAEMAALVEKVKAAGVPAVFSEAQFDPKLARALADEAGITQVVTTLYNDALGPTPADTYIGMMRYDIDEIAQALH